jgi:hypothetical protein
MVAGQRRLGATLDVTAPWFSFISVLAGPRIHQPSPLAICSLLQLVVNAILCRRRYEQLVVRFLSSISVPSTF